MNGLTFFILEFQGSWDSYGLKADIASQATIKVWGFFSFHLTFSVAWIHGDCLCLFHLSSLCLFLPKHNCLFSSTLLF
jgi:hypothetical protein